jgi:hypothetical protein
MEVINYFYKHKTYHEIKINIFEDADENVEQSLR